MENKKSFSLKIALATIFAVAIIAALIYVYIKGDVTHNILSFSTIAISLLLALIFIRISMRKIFIILGLIACVGANLILFVMPGQVKNADLVYICILCGMQFMFMLYTLSFHKSVGLIITNLAFRAMICLLAYFLLPLYYTVSMIEMISIMYMLNSFVSALSLLFVFKTHWLMAIGFLVLLASDVFMILTNGVATMLDLSLEFLSFLTTYNLTYYLCVAGIFLIAAASIFEPKTRKN